MSGPIMSSLALPVRAGIGLRTAHVERFLRERPAAGFLEIHAENYMLPSPALDRLLALRGDYAVSVHGVGLSLGSATGLDAAHLGRLRALVARLAPVAVSEHLAWTGWDGAYFNDLLPLPFTEESLAVVAANVARAQEALGRPILVENLSAYLRFAHSPIPEPEFLGELARRTGCLLLCDVNNIHVTCHNTGGDPFAYLAALPADCVGEIHLAGHARNETPAGTVLIDDHGARVAEPVWRLYRAAIRAFGRRPTLVEWDTRLPALEVLLGEAERADREAARAAMEAPHARAG